MWSGWGGARARGREAGVPSDGFHACVYIHTYIRSYIHPSFLPCMHVNMHTCTHVCVYIYMYKHTTNVYDYIHI